MRIRRRPQAQAPIPDSPLPLPPQQASDPSTAAPPNHHHCLPRCKEEEEEEELHPSCYPKPEDKPENQHSPATRRGGPLPWSHPQQGDNVVGRSGGGGGGAQRQGADGHGSLENGRRDEREWPAINAAAGGERLVVDGGMPLASTAVPQLNVKEGVKSGDGGPKRRRGPAVLLEGSRCSRVNGRGWRCSQPTLVGYSLCEHHLGKGRQSRSGRTTASGMPKLGRTEPAASGRKNAVIVAAAPDAATDPAPHLIKS